MRAGFHTFFAAALLCFFGLSTRSKAVPIWGVDLGPATATPTVTSTISPSFTQSPTFSVSPTFSASPTPSVTLSFTVSPTDTPNWTATITPDFTPTSSFSSSPTVTPTSTPGEGSYSIVFPASHPSSQLVSGIQQEGFDIYYTSGNSDFSTGLISVYFPLGLGTPNPNNFYAASANASFVSGYGFSGQYALIAVSNFPANSQFVIRYGQNQSGVFIPGTNSTESLVVSVDPSTVGVHLGVLLTQPSIALVTATVTPTITNTLTSTISPSFTVTQTFSSTPTETQTWTESPVPAQESGVFSYPNPYDMSKFDKCTFRFPADIDAKITVFNLLGEPVRELPSADINGAAGWAIWRGQDDYFHKVPGGLYYMRVRGKNTLVKKFTVLN